MLPSTDPVFLCCWSTGSDSIRDPVFLIEACAYPLPEGPTPLIPETWLRPQLPDSGELPPLRRLQALGFPPSADSLPDWREALPDLLAPLAGRALVVEDDASGFLARFQHALPEATPPVVLAISDLARFLRPRRSVRNAASLWRDLLASPPPERFRPPELRRLLEALIRSHFQREDPLRQLVGRSMEELCASIDDDGLAAEWLELARRLLDRPSRYAAETEEDLFHEALEDGLYGADLDAAPLEPERSLADIQPAFALEYEAYFASQPSLPASKEGLDPSLDDAHQAILERFFDLLPKEFSQDGKGGVERPGQRALAHAVRDALTRGELLLADAPTGTGKTLAYLAPLLLWAHQHGIRCAVSTYTRALQEQAYFRELPRALALLRRAGLPETDLPRVSMLKGRANSICGRAIVDSAPDLGSGSAIARATWLRLALHYCEDPSADLDGFGLDPGVPLGSRARVLRGARRMVDSVRSIPLCCIGRAARRCAAGVRSLRAARSHLSVTNHAFVLAQPDHFRHLVFDECDHLHQVTVSARSFEIDFEEVEKLAATLLRGRGRDRAPLERLARILSRLPQGEGALPLREAARDAGQGAGRLDGSGHEVVRELRHYLAWKGKIGERLGPEERAFLLHDYLETGPGDALATALRHFKEAVDDLDSALRTVIEELGTLADRRSGRLRWSLRIPLELLGHWREGLHLWLGGKDPSLGEGDEGDFSDDFLYEVQFDHRRKPILCLKWLLPQKWLGEVFLPSLKSAALVSATARLKGGFKAMKGYLGLDIVQEQRGDREGRTVRTFAGPPTFDPRNALVCIPEDAPAYGPVGSHGNDWLDYVEDCLLFLGERTRGRILGLFTNRLVLQRSGERLAPEFAARGIPFYWQGMPGLGKEEVMARFRERVDSVLLGLDTFWYGVDFPGRTCEYVVVTKLPFGVLDDYHYAQRARMGFGPQRHRIYLPRALAMFRQGVGRLLRNEEDRGVVLILDRRVLEKRHADFLQELPGGPEEFTEPNLLVARTADCFRRAITHMRLGAELERRGLSPDFERFRRGAEVQEP